MIKHLKERFSHTYYELVIISIVIVVIGLMMDNDVIAGVGTLSMLVTGLMPLRIILLMHKTDREEVMQRSIPEITNEEFYGSSKDEKFDEEASEKFALQVKTNNKYAFLMLFFFIVGFLLGKF